MHCLSLLSLRSRAATVVPASQHSGDAQPSTVVMRSPAQWWCATLHAALTHAPDVGTDGTDPYTMSAGPAPALRAGPLAPGLIVGPWSMTRMGVVLGDGVAVGGAAVPPIVPSELGGNAMPVLHCLHATHGTNGHTRS